MARSRETKIELTAYDDLFQTDESREEAKLSKIRDIPISEIDEFPDHPFKVLMDEDMEQLVESIKRNGVMTPATVRLKEDGRYELISGHRRKKACELAGLETLKCEVKELTRDEAIIVMVESNLQRSVILPSEKAFAYKMKVEALSHQGKRTDLTSVQLAPKLSTEIIGEAEGISKDTVKRYIRLTHLVPQLLDCMDEGKMAFSVGVELSYLNDDFQYAVLDAMAEEDCTPSYAQVVRMRNLFRTDELTIDTIYDIIRKEKANQKEKVSFKTDELSRFFPKNYTAQDMQKAILQIVEADYRRRQRNRDDGAR